MKLTVRKIAEVAQVSPATVSLVLNDKPGVGQELREKIAKMLIKNGYTIKKKELSEDMQKSILYLYYKDASWIPYMRNDFFARVLDGIERSCRQNNCSLSVANVEYETLLAMLKNAPELNYDGVVFLGTEYKHSESIFEQFSLPFVCIDRSFSGHFINSVTMDNDIGNYQAIEHLKDLGHKRIGYITCQQYYGAYPARERSFRRMMNKLSLEIEEADIFKLDFFKKDLQNDFIQLSKDRTNLPTAFIAANDIMALSAVFALNQQGYRIPEDVSVIGFDNSDVCYMTTPHLTTTSADWGRLGELAIERLYHIIEHNSKEIHNLQLGTNLVVRQTTAPPPTSA